MSGKYLGFHSSSVVEFVKLARSEASFVAYNFVSNKIFKEIKQLDTIYLKVLYSNSSAKDKNNNNFFYPAHS